MTLSSFITDFSTIHFYFQITTAQSPIIIILRYMHGLTIFASDDNLISASAKKKINVFLLFQPLKLKNKYYIFIVWQTCLVFVWFAYFDIDFNNRVSVIIVWPFWTFVLTNSSFHIQYLYLYNSWNRSTTLLSLEWL